jgi:hypothetical protein
LNSTPTALFCIYVLVPVLSCFDPVNFQQGSEEAAARGAPGNQQHHTERAHLGEVEGADQRREEGVE